jgi:predicted nucleotidyltransferase
MIKRYFNVAKKYAEVVRKDGIGIKALYIFGSRVDGKSKKWSDLDVGIVSNDFGTDRIKGLARLFYLGTKVSDLIEPHLFTESEFGDKYDVLAREIKRVGIRVI